MLDVATGRGRSTSDLRRGSRTDVFRMLLTTPTGATRAELVERTGLGAATVSVVVAELLRAGVLRTAASLPSRGGRPPALIAVNPQRGCLVGIDVAETYLGAASFDLGLTPGLDRRLPAPRVGEDVVDACLAAVRAVMPRDMSLLGVGVSVPGLVDPATGRVVRTPDGRLTDLALAQALSRRLDLPAVHLDNPLRASVMGELWAGLGREEPDIAVVTLGTGVGAGFAIEGRLRRGGTNLAGEWGHIPVDPGGRWCRCGRRGCLEAYIGAPGILLTRQEVDGSAVGDGVHMSQEGQIAALARAASELAHPQHEQAIEALQKTAERLGDGLVVLRHLVDPTLTVLGGWVADLLGPLLLPRARAHAEQRLLHVDHDSRWLTMSQLGARQVTTGGAGLALIDVIDQLTDPTRSTPSGRG